MKLAISRERAAIGAAIGAAAGGYASFMLSTFGAKEILNLPSDAIIVVVGTLLGALVGLSKYGSSILLGIDGLLFLTYVVVGYTPVMFGVASRWVRNDSMPASTDAIVVLSASVNSDGALNAEGVERLLTGLELFQKQVAPRLFTTIVRVKHAGGVLTSTADQRRLIQLGGALAGWIAVTDVFVTRDEALQVAAKLPEGARTVVVVTSPMHTRRACATFEAVGFTVVCKPAAEHRTVTWRPVAPDDRLESFNDYVYERLGMVKYRWKGWLPKT